MFVDHVRCLHNQIQTVLKMCSIKKNYIEIYDTESEQWSYNRTLMLFIQGVSKKTQPRNFLRNHFAILKHKRF